MSHTSWKATTRLSSSIRRTDRKSTRLNSSHMSISYAVFCLKKKTRKSRKKGPDMDDTAHRAIAIVAVGAVLPDAPNASASWDSIKCGRYFVRDVDRARWDPS